MMVEVFGYSWQGKIELTVTLVAHSMRMLSTKKGHKRLQCPSLRETQGQVLCPPGLSPGDSARSGGLCRACCSSAQRLLKDTSSNQKVKATELNYFEEEDEDHQVITKIQKLQ